MTYKIHITVIEQQIEEIAHLKKTLLKLTKQNAEQQEQIRQLSIKLMNVRNALNG